VRLVPIGGRTADHRRAGRPLRVLTSTTALLAGLVVLAGCQIPGFSSAPPAPTVKADIVVAETPNVGDAPLFMAFQEGLFRKAGVNVRIVNVGSTQAELKALQAGSVDVAYGDYADMFYAQARALNAKTKNGLNMVVVADGYDATSNMMEVLTVPGTHITSPKSLVGKTVATPQAEVMPAPGTPLNLHHEPYNIDTVATQSVLSNDNVNPASVSWRPEPSQDLLTDLATGKVPAILATEPTIFEAESELGAVPVVDSLSGATANLPLFGYFSLRSFANRNHAGLTAFRNALVQAQAQAAQAAAVRNTLEGSEGMSVQDASLLTIGQYPTTLNASALQRVVGLMFLYNSIPSVGGNQLSVQRMIFH
jgi:NitT/TauT family transport system substrate-binding protein